MKTIAWKQSHEIKIGIATTEIATLGQDTPKKLLKLCSPVLPSKQHSSYNTIEFRTNIFLAIR